MSATTLEDVCEKVAAYLYSHCRALPRPESRTMTPFESRASDFATYRHAAIDQRRKYTGEPYITHPEAVVALVRLVPHTETMLAAAWLHDTVEDTGATIDEIERLFGGSVASLVEMLTDVSRRCDGNRAARKAIDLAHTAKASPAAKTIKLADLIDNSLSILDGDPGFAAVYMAEKEALLEVLRSGDPFLLAMAQSIVMVYRAANADDPGSPGRDITGRCAVLMRAID